MEGELRIYKEKMEVKNYEIQSLMERKDTLYKQNQELEAAQF